MAWTSPATVIAGQLMTAAFWNTHVRDNELYLYDLALATLGGLGGSFEFGGTSLYPVTQTSYLSGAGADKLAPNSRILSLLNTNAPGTWKLEAMLAIPNAGTVTLGIMNLTDAADTTLVEVTSTSVTGASVTSGSGVTFASGTKDYGVKLKTSVGSSPAFAWGIRLKRTA